MGAFLTFSYFFHFIALLPLAGFLENAIINYELRKASLFFFSFEYFIEVNPKESFNSNYYLHLIPKNESNVESNTNILSKINLSSTEGTEYLFTYFQ